MVNITFTGTERSETDLHSLIVFANNENEIQIELEDSSYRSESICLDRDTAIKLVKELRKEIGELTK